MSGGSRSQEGAQRHEPAGLLWRRGGTTWGSSHPRHLKLGVMRSRTVQQGGVMVDMGSIKFASGRGRSSFKGGGGASPGICALL